MAVKMVMTDDGRDGVGGLQRWPRGRGGDQRVCLGGDVGAGVRTPERVKLGGPDQTCLRQPIREEPFSTEITQNV